MIRRSSLAGGCLFFWEMPACRRYCIRPCTHHSNYIRENGLHTLQHEKADFDIDRWKCLNGRTRQTSAEAYGISTRATGKRQDLNLLGYPSIFEPPGHTVSSHCLLHKLCHERKHRNHSITCILCSCHSSSLSTLPGVMNTQTETQSWIYSS